MTAERGLCGAFNSSITRLARARATALLAEGKEIKILCVGRKGRDALRRDFGRYIIETIELAGVRRVGYANAEQVSGRVLELFDEGAFDVATIFFARFKSAISQIPTAQQVIPLPPPAEGDGAVDLNGAIYEYEPDEGEILEALLPRNLSIQVFKALLENAASEQGARMSAMDNATRNAGDMINRLTLVYNRSRQAAITKELIEIISGAEAL
jgi:F-type H+-transporting ATPase subunit gamma